MDKTVSVRIDKEKLAEIRDLSKEEKRKNSEILREALELGIRQKKLAIALDKYKKKEVSIGKASEISGLPLTRFLDMLREKNVPFNYTAKDFAEDVEDLL